MSNERRLVRASELQQESIKWVYRDRIAEGMMTNICGDPAQAKTRVCLDFAARLTTGKPMPGCDTALPPSGVVVLQAEDSAAGMVKPDLTALGADLHRVVIYDPRMFKGRPLTLPGDRRIVEDAVNDVQAKLVVVDPVSAFFSCNINSDQAVRQTLHPLMELAQEKGFGLLLVQHLNKSQKGNALYQAAGAIAWVATARIALKAIDDPTSTEPHRHLLVPIKTNMVAAPSLSYRTVLSDGHIKVEWLGVSGLSAKDLHRGEYEDGSRLWEAVEILFLILRIGPHSANEVYDRARQEGVATRTLQRAKAVLNVDTGPRTYGHPGWWHWEWRLPNEDNEVLAYLRQKYAPDNPPAENTA